MGSSIKYVCRIFRKTNVRVRIRGLEMLGFREILRMYLMDGPYLHRKAQSQMFDRVLNTLPSS